MSEWNLSSSRHGQDPSEARAAFSWCSGRVAWPFMICCTAVIRDTDYRVKHCRFRSLWEKGFALSRTGCVLRENAQIISETSGDLAVQLCEHQHPPGFWSIYLTMLRWTQGGKEVFCLRKRRTVTCCLQSGCNQSDGGAEGVGGESAGKSRLIEIINK